MSDAKNTAPSAAAEEQNPRFANLSPADRFVQEAYERESPEGVGDFFTAKLFASQPEAAPAPAPAIDRDKFRAAREQAPQAPSDTPSARRPGPR